MALERKNSADPPEITHGSTCEYISHVSAANCDEENGCSGSGSKAISTANFKASSIASNLQLSQPQSTKNQSSSLGKSSNGNGNPSHQRLAGGHTTQPTRELATTSITSLLANQDHGPGMPTSKQHSASLVAQWLQDQKRDNPVPYLGVMQQGMSHEGQDF